MIYSTYITCIPCMFGLYRYDAELHMVHKAADGAISVVGVLFKLGRPDPFIGHVRILSSNIKYLLISCGVEPVI